MRCRGLPSGQNGTFWTPEKKIGIFSKNHDKRFKTLIWSNYKSRSYGKLLEKIKKFYYFERVQK